MIDTKAEVGRGTRSDLRHDHYTLLTDRLVFLSKCRGAILDEEMAEATEEIIPETCKKHSVNTERI